MNAVANGWLPLESLRVLDFSLLLSGPFATVTLADLGAEVLKIEPPGGDFARRMAGPIHVTASRNEHTLALDLKGPAARPLVERLAARADEAGRLADDDALHTAAPPKCYARGPCTTGWSASPATTCRCGACSRPPRRDAGRRPGRAPWSWSGLNGQRHVPFPVQTDGRRGARLARTAVGAGDCSALEALGLSAAEIDPTQQAGVLKSAASAPPGTVRSTPGPDAAAKDPPHRAQRARS